MHFIIATLDSSLLVLSAIIMVSRVCRVRIVHYNRVPRHSLVEQAKSTRLVGWQTLPQPGVYHHFINIYHEYSQRHLNLANSFRRLKTTIRKMLRSNSIFEVENMPMDFKTLSSTIVQCSSIVKAEIPVPRKQLSKLTWFGYFKKN